MSDIKIYNFLLRIAPFLLLTLIFSLITYLSYGEPSEVFLDTLNTICAWILVLPFLLMLAG